MAEDNRDAFICSKKRLRPASEFSPECMPKPMNGTHGVMPKKINRISSTSKRPSTPKRANKLSAREEMDSVELLACSVPHLPLIKGENLAEYEDFLMSSISYLKPTNIIEKIWLQDIIDYTWEALRLKNMKTSFIQSKMKEAVKWIIYEYVKGAVDLSQAERVAMEWSEGDAAAVEFVEGLIREHGLGESVILAKALKGNLMTIERIDKLIASYNYRRDTALRELEKRRDLLARRARDFADNLVCDPEIIPVATAK